MLHDNKRNAALGVAVNSMSYAKATRGPSTTGHQQQTNYPEGDGDLFSIDQLFTLMLGTVHELQFCSTRLDQIAVIARLLQQCLPN